MHSFHASRIYNVPHLSESWPSRFKGYASQALAYSIMKHETSWANTDRAIVEQWQSGSSGRRKLIEDICETLRSPELGDFLEGMDPTVENPPAMRSRGFLTLLSRLFLFTVPTYRVRCGLMSSMRIFTAQLVQQALPLIAHKLAGNARIYAGKSKKFHHKHLSCCE